MSDRLNKFSFHHRGKLKQGVIILLVVGVLAWILLASANPEALGQESGRTEVRNPQDKWTVESHDRTNFPLQGKHRTLSCRDCHVNNVFEGTPAVCEVCHWQRSQDDRYEQRLGAQCAECHTPLSWKKVDPGKWSHETVTGFRLEGTHRALDCEDCHTDRRFVPQPTDCYSCHQENYRQTNDPDHASAGFSTDCQICHSTRAWSDASFVHSSFPLEGRHRTLACSDCHANGVYQGTPTDCAACHLDDYNSASEPNHAAAGFPTACDSCHSVSHASWGQAVFNHTFPITSGRHSGFDCTECHTTSNYQQFNCLNCHEKSSTDSHHGGVTGYTYSSQACFACHPGGSGEAAGRPSAKL